MCVFFSFVSFALTLKELIKIAIDFLINFVAFIFRENKAYYFM